MEYPDRKLSNSMTSFHHDERLWTINDAAEYLSLSRRTIERARHEGRFPPGYRIGRSMRFEAKSVIEWARSGKETA